MKLKRVYQMNFIMDSKTKLKFFRIFLFQLDSFRNQQQTNWPSYLRKYKEAISERVMVASQGFFPGGLLKIGESTLTWITGKELEREINNNGDQFCWKKNMKII